VVPWNYAGLLAGQMRDAAYKHRQIRRYSILNSRNQVAEVSHNLKIFNATLRTKISVNSEIHVVHAISTRIFRVIMYIMMDRLPGRESIIQNSLTPDKFSIFLNFAG
jgi:hypothetical protein